MVIYKFSIDNVSCGGYLYILIYAYICFNPAFFPPFLPHVLKYTKIFLMINSELSITTKLLENVLYRALINLRDFTPRCLNIMYSYCTLLHIIMIRFRHYSELIWKELNFFKWLAIEMEIIGLHLNSKLSAC